RRFAPLGATAHKAAALEETAVFLSLFTHAMCGLSRLLVDGSEKKFGKEESQFKEETWVQKGSSQS
ncbi:MAG: hypothetical protein ACE5GQ_10225, partial [Nitrospinales bacterium]